MSVGSEESFESSNIEEDEKEVTPVESTTELAPSVYTIKPAVSDAFKTIRIKEIIESVLNEMLTGKKYTETDAKEWTKSIADVVSTRVKDLGMKRFKHVVQVMLGNQLGAGCKFMARCRWDADCDNQTSDVFTNATIFCVVTVFGTYHY